MTNAERISAHNAKLQECLTIAEGLPDAGGSGKEPVLGEITINESGVYDASGKVHTATVEDCKTIDNVLYVKEHPVLTERTIEKLLPFATYKEESIVPISLVPESNLVLVAIGPNKEWTISIVRATHTCTYYPVAAENDPFYGTIAAPGWYKNGNHISFEEVDATIVSKFDEGIGLDYIANVFNVESTVDGWSKITVDIPILEELVVTKNGVYDDLDITTTPEIVSGTTLSFNENIVLSQENKNKLKTLASDNSVQLYESSTNPIVINILIYDDDTFAIYVWQDNSWGNVYVYVSKEMIKTSGQEWQYGITTEGWHSVENNVVVGACPAPTFIVDPDAIYDEKKLRYVADAFFGKTTSFNGWQKVTVDVQAESILGELVVTANGVYDKPTAKVPPVIAVGETLTFKENVIISDELKDILYPYNTGSDDESVWIPIFVNEEQNFESWLYVFPDGEYIIVAYTINDIYETVYISESMINLRGEDPWYGISVPGWYLYNYDTQEYQPCSPLAITINSDTVMPNGITNIEMLNLYTEVFDTVVGDADGWNKVTVNLISDMIDVESLPDENVDASKVYRVVENNITSANFYINDGVTVQTLDDKAKSMGWPTPGYYIPVEELPETLSDSPVDIPAGAVPIFISTVTGETRAFIFGEAKPLQDEVNSIFGTSYDLHGIAESVDDMTEVGYYVLFGKETIVKSYGIPDEANNKTVYEHNGTEWVECGGDSIVVDVDELPTENIDEGKIYRVTEESSVVDVYVYTDQIRTLHEFAQTLGAPPESCFTYHIVESCPETLILSDDATFNYHVYIILKTGESYVTFNNAEFYQFMADYNGIPLDDYRGAISDVSEITEPGYYYCVTRNIRTVYGIPDDTDSKTVYEHDGSGWVECTRGGIVDVEELPTENVDPNKIYRIINNIKPVAEPYLTSAYHEGALPLSTVYCDVWGLPLTTKIVYHYVENAEDMVDDMCIDSATLENEYHIYIALYYNGMPDGVPFMLWNGNWRNVIQEIPESDFYTYRGVVSDVSEIDINQPGYWHLISDGGLVYTYGVSKIGDRTKFYEHDGGWTEYISKEISDELEQQISDRDNQIDALDIKIGVMNFCITDEQYKKFLNVASFVRSYANDEFKLISINDKTIDSITIPQCFYSIEPYAFDGCASLTEVILPEGVRFVDNGAFNNCTALEYIKFPSTFEQNGFYPYSYPYVNPFMGCTALQVMDFSDVTKVIRCPKSDSIPSTCKIIVPDELYTMWIDNQYGWKGHKDNIIKASEAT